MPSDEVAIRATITLIAADYPDVPVDGIAQLFRQRHARTAAAPIQQFRLVLAERDTRAALRAQARARARPTPHEDRDFGAADLATPVGRSALSSRERHRSAR